LAVLVIAGSGRGAGKTAVGCALIRACPELRWLAVKVTPHRHDLPQGLAEETDRNSDKDTGRYLAAGASRAFLLSGEREGEAVARVADARQHAPECDSLLVESNRISAEAIARPRERMVDLAVLAGAEPEWKASLAACLGWADAVVLATGLSPEELATLPSGKPIFRLAPGEWSSPDFVRFVRERMLAAE